MSLDGRDSKVRDPTHIIYAREKVRSDSLSAALDVNELEPDPKYRLVSLEGLVRMKLNSFRDKDRMLLRDMLKVGLIDESWCGRFPQELAARRQQVVENPVGWRELGGRNANRRG